MKHALHLITTGRQTLEHVIHILSACPEQMIDVIHIREKHRSARDIWQWYTQLKTIVPHTDIYINDRLDVAAAVGAPGVQLGYSSLPPDAARTVVSASTKIGCSVHSSEEAIDAHNKGATFVMFGHVYSTASKPDLAPRGIEALRDIVASVRIPVIAIGGIEPHRVEEVMSAGCAGIAVMSAVFEHPQPERQVVRFREALDRFNNHQGGVVCNE